MRTIHEVATEAGWDRYLATDSDGNDVDRDRMIEKVVSETDSRIVVECEEEEIEIQRLHIKVG